MFQLVAEKCKAKYQRTQHMGKIRRDNLYCSSRKEVREQERNPILLMAMCIVEPLGKLKFLMCYMLISVKIGKQAYLPQLSYSWQLHQKNEKIHTQRLFTATHYWRKSRDRVNDIISGE